ncbi:DUF2335 domain-containing protein [Pluralibacter gergoviae]|nr:DUF2335 domain-containing protein [Pluralibacter gergoviae]ELC3016386.1 DUF2335 domain-containing protein [Pluralibacter gergoviae]ELC3021366.1 DUF2335 domain-containing protein [Pluralibacter gergoviae]
MQPSKSQPAKPQSAAIKAESINRQLESNPEVLDAFLRSEHFQVIAARHTMHSGPLPSPKTLEEYDSVLPGGAERIFAMAEKEQQARHKYNDDALNGEISLDRRGQWMGFSISIIILVMAAVFAWLGNTAFAGTLVAIDLIALASVFVIGRRSDKSDK